MCITAMTNHMSSWGFFISFSAVQIYNLPCMYSFVFFIIYRYTHILTSSQTSWSSTAPLSQRSWVRIPARGEGESHMKQTGMLVVSLRGCKFWILDPPRVFWAKAPILYAAKVSFRVPRRNTELREEKQGRVVQSMIS